MSAVLPPEDQPPFMLMIPADQAMAEAAMGPNTRENPIAVAWAIKQESARPVRSRRLLRSLVTPESRQAWGNFRWVHELIGDCAVTTQPNRALGDRDVVYVKFVTEYDSGAQQVTQEAIIGLRAGMTMVSPSSARGLVRSRSWLRHGPGRRPARRRTWPLTQASKI